MPSPLSPRGRRLAWASVIGALVACASVVTVLAWANQASQPEVDGEFVLDQPGVYAEPIVTVAVDGTRLPNESLRDADDRLVPVASLLGRPLVINVWYSTCPGCAEELRAFAEVSGGLGAAASGDVGDVVFVGVDPVDDAATMLAFAEARGVAYRLLRDPEQQFVKALGLTGFPTTLFVAADGRIVKQTGQLDADELRAAIADAF